LEASLLSKEISLEPRPIYIPSRALISYTRPSTVTIPSPPILISPISLLCRKYSALSSSPAVSSSFSFTGHSCSCADTVDMDVHKSGLVFLEQMLDKELLSQSVRCIVLHVFW